MAISPALNRELNTWPLITMHVRVNLHDSLFRKIRTKDGTLTNSTSELAKRSGLAGWWEPFGVTSSRWLLFPLNLWEAQHNPPFFAEFPEHFGGTILTCAKCIDNKNRTIYLGEGIKNESWVFCKSESAKWEELKHFPTKLVPEERDPKRPVKLLGAFWTGGRRVYALWGQDAIPVGISLIKDISELFNFGVIEQNKIRFSKISLKQICNFEDAYLNSINNFKAVNFREEGLRKCSMGECPTGRGSGFSGIWTKLEGWKFFVLKADYSIFKPAYDIIQPINYKEKGFNYIGAVTTLHNNSIWKEAASTDRRFLGKVEQGNITKYLPDLNSYYKVTRDDFISHYDDKIESALLDKLGNKYALICNGAGRKLGWELFFGMEEIQAGGYLLEPHIRRFINPTLIENCLKPLRSVLASKIKL